MPNKKNLLKLDWIENCSWDLYDASEDNYEDLTNALWWILFRWANSGYKSEFIVIILNSIFKDMKFYAEKTSLEEMDKINKNIIINNNKTYFDIINKKNALNQIIDILKSKK